jgi:hypothetical protein
MSAPEEDQAEEPRDHDAGMNPDEVDLDHSKMVAQRIREIVPAKLFQMKAAPRDKGLQYGAAFAAASMVHAGEAKAFLELYREGPHKSSQELIANLEHKLSHDALDARKDMLRKNLDEFCDMQVGDDGPTAAQNKTIRKMKENIENAQAHNVDANAALIRIVSGFDGWTPVVTKEDRTGQLGFLSKMGVGLKQLEELYEKVGLKLPEPKRRQALCLGDRGDWITFFNEEMDRHYEDFAAGKRDKLPEVDEKICARWLAGKYRETPAGRSGPENWREMIVEYNGGLFEDFRTLNPETKKRKYWIEHIEHSAGTVAAADRGSIHNPVANNAQNFGVLVDVINKDNLMQSSADSAVKLAFWGNNIVQRAKSSSQEGYKGVEAAAKQTMSDDIRSGKRKHEHVTFRHSGGRLETERQMSLIEGTKRARKPAKIDAKPLLLGQQQLAFTSAAPAEPVQEDMDTGSSSSDAPLTPPGSPPSALQPSDEPVAEPASDAALQAEKDKRGGVKASKNGSKACNWWVGDATTGHYCGKTAGYSADKTTGLFRCIDHGGDREQLKRGRTSDGKPESRYAGRLCPAWFLRPDHPNKSSGNYPTGKYNGFKWTGRCCNQTCADAIAKALYQHEHEGVPYPEGFRPPPPTSAPSAAATTQ